MQQEGGNGIHILSRGIEEGQNDHSKEEHGDIAEQNGERVAHEQIEQPFGEKSFPVLVAGHNGKRADVGAAQFAIVAVVIIVRTAPNRAGANQNGGQARPRQDGAMLLVMVDDKKPEDQQAGQSAANDAQGHGPNGKSSGDGCREEKCCGKNAPPAFPGIIPCIRFGTSVKSLGLAHERAQRPRDDGCSINEV
jgi:hypothetical protein